MYPNLYVILAGPPGKLGKSTVIRMGRKILLHVPDIHMSADSVTREELIHVMSHAKVAGTCAITVHSTELSSIIDPSGIKMIQFLTDIYDCDDTWAYATKGSGRNRLSRPVLNMLAGTTPSWMADGFPATAIDHGFTARTVFVYEDSPRFLVPRPIAPDERTLTSLAEDLKQIALLEGEFRWAEGATDAYDSFYHQLYKVQVPDYRIAGFHWRKRTHLLKLAMLLSVAEDEDLVISEREISVASELLKQVELNMPRSFSAVGKYDYSSDLERILAFVVQEGEVDLAEIVRKNYHVGGQAVQEIIQTLKAMHVIDLRQDGAKNWTVRATSLAANVVQVGGKAPKVRSVEDQSQE